MIGYAGFSGTVGGEQHEFRSGFFRFHFDAAADGLPRIERLEFLRSVDNNAWGVGLSEEGLLFGSTANGNPSVWMPIANRYYEAVRGWNSTVLPAIADSDRFEPVTDNVRQVDYHGSFTAAAGHAPYTARVYPRQYWNRTAFVADPTGHLVATFVIEPQGAGFRSKNAWNLLASRDEWTAPIAAEVGPDGNVWVIDWYNLIVQHNPTPAGFETGQGSAYQTELHDKTRGRIYRVVADGAAADGAAAARQRQHRRAGRRPRASEHDLAAARPAVAGRARSTGRRAGHREVGSDFPGRSDRDQCRGHACAVDARRPRGDRFGRWLATVDCGLRRSLCRRCAGRQCCVRRGPARERRRWSLIWPIPLLCSARPIRSCGWPCF